MHSVKHPPTRALFCGGYIKKPPQNNALGFGLNASSVCCAKGSSQRLLRADKLQQRRAVTRTAAHLRGWVWGSQFSPCLGTEVIVDFLGGDLDQPVRLAG
jgi:hypothetical protein